MLEVRAARAEESLRELAGPDLTITNGFPEVLRCVWHAPADAQHAHYAPLMGPEPIHMKEMRGFVRVARLMCEDRRAWFHKHLVLGDNLGVMLAISKGRCAQPGMLMLLR